ncbi:MAG: beta-ketoacyl-ACP synthase [bacterium]|nr:beta-ketoacyl-ACP synthase [bacterium]
MKRRVVVTGMGGVSPLGDDWVTVGKKLEQRTSSIEVNDELSSYQGMDTRLASRVRDFETPKHYTRKRIRTMGRVSLLATRATELALLDAGLSEVKSDPRIGLSYGSTAGSPPAMETYAKGLQTRELTRIRATDYIQFMSHTVPANLAQFYQVTGRLIPTCSACTSGSQGIGYGFEAIQFGKQEVMLTGGAEEYHPLHSGVFDIMFATSTRNEDPASTPRPFDRDRDGLVVGEGAATLVLEEHDHALARGASIYAELVGWGTNGDGKHVTNPDTEGMQDVMEIALADAGLDPGQIDYVSAHGTATEVGDIAESQAMFRVFGSRVPTSSLKSYMGHTLGACGAIEAWLSIEMMRSNWFSPTLNLDNLDPRCGELDYVQGAGRTLEAEYIMSNNFAFGGVNTSLIFRRWA